MCKLARIVSRYPHVIVACIVILTIFFAFQFRYIKMETDVTKQIPPIPEKKYLDKIKDIFGTTGEYVIIGIVAPPGKDIFNQATLKKIRTISREADSLTGVDDVISPTEMDYIKGTEWGIEVNSVLGDRIPQSYQEMQQYKKRIMDNKIFEGIVSKDGRAASIMVSLNEKADKAALAKKIEKIAREEEGPEKIYIGGKTVVDSSLGELMMRDLTYLIPLILLVIVIILYLNFRTFMGVLLPLTTVAISTVWAIGGMSLLKIPLSIVTFILPILLMAVGTAYGIHILNRYYELSDRKSKAKIVEATLTKVGNAVLVAGLTTIAGFSSLAVSEMKGLRTFGLLSAFGIGAALCFSLLFIPSLIMFLPARLPDSKKKKSHLSPDDIGYLSSFLGKLGEGIYRKKIAVLFIAGAITLFFVAGIPLLSTESNPLLFFPSNNPCRVAEDVLNRYFMGTTPLQVIIKTPHPDGIKEPRVLKAMDGLENYVKNLPYVGGVTSINNFVKSINKALHQDKENFYVIPNTRQEVAQYLLLYSMSADPKDFEKFVNNDFQMANIMIFLKSGHTAKIKKVISDINSYVKKNFPSEVEVKVTGEGFLFPIINTLLVNTFIRSIILSLVLVFVISAVIFRSLKAGLFSLIPISIAILINFGVMGWFKIPLNIGTVAIAAIAVGIGIDYAVHFVSRLQAESANQSVLQALVTTTRTTGKAIFYNAVTVSAGFLVLMASSIKWYQFMGGLMSLVMVISATGALTILPATMIITRSKLMERKDSYVRDKY